jgi:ABC-2 type transport system ATP-binding protein
MSANVIEVRDLIVGDITRRPVSFNVAAGEIHALVGRQATGKTAILEAVSGHRRPVSGTIHVCGIDPYGRQDAIRLGTVWREGGLFPGLTVAEVIDTWRRWTLDPISRDEAVFLAGLAERTHVRFERLTPAELRRLDLALALIGRSDVLFLDEPTADLDPDAHHDIWATLRALAGRGVTILLSTRDAGDVRLADHATRLDEVARKASPSAVSNSRKNGHPLRAA